MSEQLDCVVIGAGVVGLAIARRMAMTGREVVLPEVEEACGTHTRAHNSEITHAGMYYASGSMKAGKPRFTKPSAVLLPPPPGRHAATGAYRNPPAHHRPRRSCAGFHVFRGPRSRYSGTCEPVWHRITGFDLIPAIADHVAEMLE